MSQIVASIPCSFGVNCLHVEVFKHVGLQVNMVREFYFESEEIDILKKSQGNMR